jgi:hypothetical protein
LINFSGNRLLPGFFLGVLVLAGCAAKTVRIPSPVPGTPQAGAKSLIAVMPVENLTGLPVPVEAVKKSLVAGMSRKGLNVLGEEPLERFLERHRVRYVGGINRELAKALGEETGADAVLFTSLELFDEGPPPKAALSARMVSARDKAEILWAGSVGISGNDHPGFLLLGLIDDPTVIWENARDNVLGSLAGYLAGRESGRGPGPEKKFAPKSFHSVLPRVPAGKGSVSVAVLPFRNDSTRRNAGEIMALHFFRELSNTGGMEVVEAGEIRQVLLQSRTIMEGGLSLPQADILHEALGVDLVLTGIVTEYQDSIGGSGTPKVEFSTRVFDMQTRQIVWSSSSYNQGDDEVYFFDIGKVNTAHGMASGMVRSVVGSMWAAVEAGKEGAARPVRSGPRR